MELAPGEMLGPYRLVERAGAGGMAEVWRAYQPRLARYVAVKILPRHLASQPGYVERFEREAQAISRLAHPNILTVHDFGEQDGFSYMASPFVVSGTLSQRLGRPWPLDGQSNIYVADTGNHRIQKLPVDGQRYPGPIVT